MKYNLFRASKQRSKKMNKAYIRFPEFKRKAVTLSYDDGVRQDKRLIEIMKKNGLKGTFNLNSGYFSESYNGETKGRMTKQEALELYLPSGMEVAVHGYKHLSLARVDSAVATADIVCDRKELEKTFGEVITGMAYANGSYSDEVVEMLKQCGIRYSRTTISTERFDLPEDWLRLPATCHHNNPRLMELAKSFVEQGESPYYWANEAKLFYLWGHSYEFDEHNNWRVIEEFAEYIGGREDIWYATNGAIYAYLQACERLEFGINGDCVYNPSSMDVYIDYYGKKVKIKGGERVSL